MSVDHCDVCGQPAWQEDDGLMLCGPCWNHTHGHTDTEGHRP